MKVRMIVELDVSEAAAQELADDMTANFEADPAVTVETVVRDQLERVIDQASLEEGTWPHAIIEGFAVTGVRRV